VRSIRDHPANYYPVWIFLLFRVLLLFWMWGLRQTFSQPIVPDPVLRPYLGVAIEQNPWLEPWQRWDTLHYQAISERGYTAFDSALFTPPLYPLLMKAGSSLLGGNTLLAGILVSNIAFLCSLFVFFRLVVYETQNDDGAARSTLYLASFPSSFFFFAAYTESLFLLCSLLTITCVLKGKWWQAGIWGGLAAMTRMPGLLIVIPLIYSAVLYTVKERAWKPWVSVMLTLTGGALLPLYIWLVLRLPPWFSWGVLEARSQGRLSLPGANILVSVREIMQGTASLSNLIDLVFLLFFLACFVPVWRRLPRIYSLYYLTFLGLYLIRISEIETLLSVNRYVLVLFPAFIVMGAWGRNPVLHRIILYLSWIGLLYLSGQFAIWGWAG
jgi:hypothetical protein